VGGLVLSVFRAGGTTGGTDIIARLAHRFLGIKLGHTLLAANVVILGSAALIFGLEPAMYALLLAFVSSRVIDVVQEGLSQSRSTMIICRRSNEVRAAILGQMERGVTVLHGEGGYTGEPRDVLVCAVPQTEVSRLSAGRGLPRPGGAIGGDSRRRTRRAGRREASDRREDHQAVAGHPDA